MRSKLVPPGVKHLEYEIRNIVDDAYRFANLGVEMVWENIGDPIAAGENVVPWIQNIVQELISESASWAYCHSRGVLETREFLAGEVNRRGGVQIDANDILFVNGIADAVDKIYDLIRKDARVIMPTPCYPTHSSNEAKRGEYPYLFFHLDPEQGWKPDLDQLRNMVKYNPQVVAIAFVHPDNPTGYVYPREVLKEIVAIAREFNLFIICDEVYAHITFNGAERCHLSTVIEDVPALSLRGISKEYPWPGARCGWMEILNRGKDAHFDSYADALIKSKMMEVCSTTLPQLSIPKVFGHPDYPDHLNKRAKIFESRANEAYDLFSAIDGLTVNRVQGALYFPVVFKDGTLNNNQTLPIDNPKVKALVEGMVPDFMPDKRFVYYLMASVGICVTPLSGFHSELQGFRITLLQNDDNLRRETLTKLGKAISEYIGS